MDYPIEMGMIPYNELEHLGLEQRMIDDLPQGAIDNLLFSRPSPLLSLSMKDHNGEQRNFHGRIILAVFGEGDNEELHVLVVPKMKEATGLEEFDDDEQHHLIDGNVLKYEDENGMNFIQFDNVTNQVCRANAAAIDYNISVMTDNTRNRKYFNDENVEMLREGRHITISDEDEKGQCTIGIDLLTPTGLRVAAGNEDSWREQRNTDNLNRYNFGLYGCWTLNPDDSLSYTPEEEYSEEMSKAHEAILNREQGRSRQQTVS